MSVASAGTSDSTLHRLRRHHVGLIAPLQRRLLSDLALHAVADLRFRQRRRPCRTCRRRSAAGGIGTGRSGAGRCAGRRRASRRALRTARTARPTARAASGPATTVTSSVSSTAQVRTTVNGSPTRTAPALVRHQHCSGSVWTVCAAAADAPIATQDESQHAVPHTSRNPRHDQPRNSRRQVQCRSLRVFVARSCVSWQSTRPFAAASPQ